jgi:hypothetical protein
MDYRSIRPYLLGLIVLICTGLIGLHGFWVGLYVTVVFEIVTGLCRSPGQSVINPITGEGTLYLYRMRSEPFTQSGFKVDLTHVRRLIPYSIPALMGVVTGVYTDIYRNPILVELTSIVIDCQGNCEIFYECTEYHSKMFVSSAHE